MADDALTLDAFLGWPTPAEAVAMLPASWELVRKRVAIAKRLHSGTMIAVAETVAENGRVRDLLQVKRTEFSQLVTLTEYGEMRDFWERGELEGGPSSTTGYDCPAPTWHATGIRFGQTGLGVLLRQNGVVPPPEKMEPPSANSEAAQEADPARTKTLSGAEQDAFIRLALATYSTVPTELFVHRAILALYPEHAISRDPFIARLRAIRGHKPRGKTATKRD